MLYEYYYTPRVLQIIYRYVSLSKKPIHTSTYHTGKFAIIKINVSGHKVLETALQRHKYEALQSTPKIRR